MTDEKKTLQTLAKRLVTAFAERGLTVATAESCTGGLVAKLITDIPGSSAVFKGGFVTYTNAAKIDLLGVDPTLIERDTEVSRSCACAMAEGARKRLRSDAAVSLTGYAGPGGGTEKDPVGTVYIGISTEKGSESERFSAPEGADREAVREAAAARALTLLLALCDA